MDLFLNSPKVATVFGGSGFLGRYIVKRLVGLGWKIKIVTRNKNKAEFLNNYGTSEQIKLIELNLLNSEDEIQNVIIGSSVVINCVGILQEIKDQTFISLHFELVKKIAILSKKNGVKKLIHISSIGADPNSDSFYAKSKGLGEIAVLKEFDSSVIFRPSVVFGEEDQFFNRFAKMAVISPVIPIVGGTTFFQPVFVGDLALAVEKAILDKVIKGIYEIGGPEVLDFNDLIVRMLKTLKKKRLILKLPFLVGKAMAFGFSITNFLSFGVFQPQITFDQIRQLRKDNIVSSEAKGLDDLNIKATPIDSILPSYIKPLKK